MVENLVAIRRAPLAQVRRKRAKPADNSAAVNAQLIGSAGQAFSQWHLQKLAAEQATQTGTAMAKAKQAMAQFEQTITESKVIDVDGVEVPIYSDDTEGRSHLISQMSDFHSKLRNELSTITQLPGSKAEVEARLTEMMGEQSIRLQDHEQDLFIEDQLVKTNEAAETMVDMGDYAGAREIYQSAFDAGVLTGPQFTKMSKELSERQDFMGIFGTIRDAKSDSDLSNALGMLDKPPASLSPEKLTSLYRDIDMKQRQMDKDAEDRITQAQDSTFADALIALSDPEQTVTITDVEQLKGRVTPSMFQSLVGLARQQSQSGVSDVKAMRFLRGKIATLGASGAGIEADKAAVRNLIIMAMSGIDPMTGEQREPSIKPNEGSQLLSDLDTVSERVFSTPRYRQAIAIGQSTILKIRATGVEADINALLGNVDPAMASRYTDFTTALMEHIEQNPNDNPIEWAKSNVWTYASDVDESINQVHLDKIGDRRVELGRKMLDATTDEERAKVKHQLDALNEAYDIRSRKAAQQ